MGPVHNLEFWRNKAEELEKELLEFQESSQLLEKELENSLEQSDKTIKELRLKNNQVQFENDTLKEKFDELKKATVSQLTDLQDENDQLRKREDEYIKYIRELEQKNDDLERSQRATYTSLGEFETKLNLALERNVLLESELDEKESLKAMVQRLKDEARDLKQEIQVRKTLDTDKRVTDSNKLEPDDTVVQASSTPPLKSLNLSQQSPSRVSAMNIVADLLRTVGILESKLANPINQRDSGQGDNTKENYRGRRLNRGTSSPSIHTLVRS